VEPALLYIIYHPGHRAIKIGISDVSGKRFIRHRQNGWVLVKYWYFFERDKARHIESLVIETLRKKHKVYLHKQDMPQNGYTETFDANMVKRLGLIRLINKTIRNQ
jgi:hypothetical protein